MPRSDIEVHAARLRAAVNERSVSPEAGGRSVTPLLVNPEHVAAARTLAGFSRELEETNEMDIAAMQKKLGMPRARFVGDAYTRSVPPHKGSHKTKSTVSPSENFAGMQDRECHGDTHQTHQNFEDMLSRSHDTHFSTSLHARSRYENRDRDDICCDIEDVTDDLSSIPGLPSSDWQYTGNGRPLASPLVPLDIFTKQYFLDALPSPASELADDNSYHLARGLLEAFTYLYDHNIITLRVCTQTPRYQHNSIFGFKYLTVIPKKHAQFKKYMLAFRPKTVKNAQYASIPPSSEFNYILFEALNLYGFEMHSRDSRKGVYTKLKPRDRYAAMEVKNIKFKKWTYMRYILKRIRKAGQ